jgi:2-phospho-L-lactate/phosphoenolpyruvate guanylyltransferase
MGVWVVIPVKPLNRAKTRLAPVLSPAERQQLAETMLRHVLGVVSAVPQLMGTLVISRDNKALSIARGYGARTVQESGAPELNAALRRATTVIMQFGGEAILVLPADLPLIQTADVQAILALGKQTPSMVIATDHATDGTNALFLRPPDLVQYGYGPGSFHRHMEQSTALGIQPKIYQSERLSLDIDVPDDLQSYNVLMREKTTPSG